LKLVLRRDEAAEALGISRDVFDTEVAPAIRWLEIDGREVVSVAELEAWLAKRSRGAHEFRTKAAPA